MFNLSLSDYDQEEALQNSFTQNGQIDVGKLIEKLNSTLFP